MDTLRIDTGMNGVVLEELRIKDANPYFRAVKSNREHLSQHGDTTADKYKSRLSVLKSIVLPDNPDKLRLAVRQNSVFAGTINATPRPDGTEIGYWLDEQYTGSGIATVATRSLCQYLRGEVARIIYAHAATDNFGSRAVLERSNFFQSGAIQDEHATLVYTYLDPLY